MKDAECGMLHHENLIDSTSDTHYNRKVMKD